MLKLKLSTLATSCEELTHWKRLWCWEGLGAGGEGDDRGWDGWMASPTRCTWVWVNSGSWWWIGRPGVLQFMGSQRVGHDWVTELHWTECRWQVTSGWNQCSLTVPKILGPMQTTLNLLCLCSTNGIIKPEWQHIILQCGLLNILSPVETYCSE